MLKLNQITSILVKVLVPQELKAYEVKSTRVIVHSTQGVVGRYRLPEVSRN